MKNFLAKHWFSFILLGLIIFLQINKADYFHDHYQFTAIENNSWECIEDGTVMYSQNALGTIGPADKGCSCDTIRDFELRIFGEVDEESLKNDFGC